MGAGQLLLDLADPQSATLFILVAILISIATVPLALTAQRAPDFTVPRHERVRELLAKSPLGVIGVFVAGALGATFVALGPAYAAIIGLEAPAIAAFMSTGIFAATAAQLPLGRWSDRTDRRTVILSVSLVAALAAIATTAVEGGSLLFMTIASLCTGLSLTLYPLAAAHVNDHLDSSQLVAASSTLILINGAGAIVGPLVVATAMQAAGARAYFGAFALLHVALGLYVVWRKTRTQRRVAREQRAVHRRRTAIVADGTARQPRVSGSPRPKTKRAASQRPSVRRGISTLKVCGAKRLALDGRNTHNAQKPQESH